MEEEPFLSRSASLYESDDDLADYADDYGDEDDSAETVLDALDTHYDDPACAALASAVRELGGATDDEPVRPARVRELIAEVAALSRPRVVAVTADRWRSAVLLFGAEALRALFRAVYGSLLEHSSEIQRAAEFWRAHRSRPVAAMIAQGPLHTWEMRPRLLTSAGADAPGPGGWKSFVAVAERRALAERVARLDKLGATFAFEVGRLHSELRDINFGAPLGPPAAHLYKFLSEGRHVPRVPHLALIDAVAEAVPAFEARLSAHVREIGVPSHFQRNWLRYAALATGAALVAGTVAVRWREVRDGVSDAAIGTAHFAREMIWEPLRGIYVHVTRTFRGGKGGRGGNSVSKHPAAMLSSEKEKETLFRMLRDFADDHASAVKAEKGATKQPMDRKQMRALSNETYEASVELMQEVSRDGARHPLTAAISGRLAHALTIKGQQVLCGAAEALENTQRVMDGNRITFYLLALMQGGIVVGGTYYASRWAWRRATGRGGRAERAARVAMHECVRQAEDLLIHSAEVAAQPPVDSMDAEADMVDTGRLLCVLHDLEATAETWLDSGEMQLLRDDLGMLRSWDLAAAQKLRIVERMYRTHGFLGGSGSVADGSAAQ